MFKFAVWRQENICWS